MANGTGQDGSCYICGKATADTKDHIVPQNLFPVSLRTNLWTARACRGCNDRLAPDEELFRVFVTGQVGEDSIGLEVWRTGVRRTLAKQPRLKAMMASQMRLVEVRTPGGLYVGRQWMMPARVERINSVLEKIVRGLYYRETRRLLGEAVLQVGFNPQDILPDLLRRAKRGFLNKPIFEFAWVEAEDDERARIWWLLFFKKVLFMVASCPPSRVEKHQELAESDAT